MSHLREEENVLQLPFALASAIRSAAAADQSAEGDSPPPSRPAPQNIAGKRRRQFKSTENVSRGFTDDNTSRDNLRFSGEADNDVDDSRTGPRGRPQTASKSGWDEESGASNEIMSRGSRSGRRSMGSSQDMSQGRSNEDVDDDPDSKRGSRSRFAKQQDGVMIIIPDLNDAEEEEMATSIAAPPSLKVNKVRTMRELDADLSASTGLLNENMMHGVDFSYLSGIALCPPEQVYEEDKHWDWDVVLTELASEMQKDEGVVGGGVGTVGGGGLIASSNNAIHA
ncbi:intraflagellar transport protein 43-domain-containing protein [Zopfochytrium polystomum]|nr:intraflagellar transport protein 43-domain-containing protein [Zopfochytrium polystomum]